MDRSIRDFFDESARGRDSVISGNPVIDYEQRVRSRAVLELLGASPGESILDVGCGNGRDLPPLVRMGCRCVALDYSEGMVKEARAHLAVAGVGAVPLLVGDGTRLPFADGRFDRVFASEVIEHIPDYRRAIREMARVLRPGGTLVLTTPNRRSWYGMDRFILERVLRRPWNHPFDQWKAPAELADAVSSARLRITRRLGVCYVPGFVMTYRLPRVLKKLVIHATASVEDRLSRWLPGNGYMLAIRAEKSPM